MTGWVEEDDAKPEEEAHKDRGIPNCFDEGTIGIKLSPFDPEHICILDRLPSLLLWPLSSFLCLLLLL